MAKATFLTRRKSNMNAQIKAYGFFLLFTVITAAVVKPMAKQANIPFLKDL